MIYLGPAKAGSLVRFGLGKQKSISQVGYVSRANFHSSYNGDPTRYLF